MSNLLQYTLSLQDKISKRLEWVGRATDEAKKKFSTLQETSKKVQAQFHAFGTTISSLKSKLDLLRSEREIIPTSNLRAIRQYTREIQRLETQIDRLENKRGFFSRIFGGRGALMSFARSALPIAGIAGLGMAAFGGLKTSINAGMDASKNIASFETLSGKEAGGKLFKDVKKFAEESIYGNELYDNAIQMRAFGIETEKIMPQMKMLGDVAMGSKEKLASLTLAFSQIQSAQKLQGQDLLQLINAGFNPLTIIADKTGIKYGELRKKMEDGAISSEMVTQAFKVATSQGGQFYNMTEKIAQTPFGKWEAFKGQLEGIATNIGMKLLPVVSKAIDFFSKGADNAFAFAQMIWSNLRPVFESLSPVISMIGGFLGRVYNIIGNIVRITVKALGPALSALINILKGPLKVALAIAEFAFKALEKVIQAVAWAIEKVKQAWDWVKGLFKSRLMEQFEEAAKIYETQGEAAAKAYLQGFKNANIAEKISGELSGAANVLAAKGAAKIGAAKLPGASPFDWKNSFNKSDKEGGRNKANESVATGGSKNTTIHISIGKQIETLQVVSNNIREGAEKIRDIIVDEMTRALAMSQAIAD